MPDFWLDLWRDVLRETGAHAGDWEVSQADTHSAFTAIHTFGRVK